MKLRNLIIALTAISLTGISGAQAFNKKQFQAVKAGQQQCLWCDLIGANLANIKLRNIDLSGANLTGADLSGAKFHNVDLSGADLTGAKLDGTDLSGSKLTGADLDQVDLSTAILTGTKVEKAYCDFGTKFPTKTGLFCEGVTVEIKN